MPEVFDNVRYEGYGPGGAAVVVDCPGCDRESMTVQMRSVFRRWGGHLGARGAVSYLFNHVGVLVFAPSASGRRLFQAALQAGAEDVVTNSDGSMHVLTDPIEFEAVRTKLATEGHSPVRAWITWRAACPVALRGDEAVSMARLLESLQALTGVQNVYTNAEIPDEVLARV